MNAINRSVHQEFFLHWLKSTIDKQVPHEVFGFYGWWQVCDSLVSFLPYFKGPEILPTVTGELGNQQLWWCSPYAPVPRQAWLCASVSPKSQEPSALRCLSALVQKELNNKSWSTTLLEFRDEEIFGGCLAPVWLPKWIALLLAWRDTDPSELLQNCFLEGFTL